MSHVTRMARKGLGWFVFASGGVASLATMFRSF
jgi:hypothetical protein